MLAPADAAVADRDPAVPGLATVLDPGALVAALRARHPDADVTGATATYVRYKPTTNCIVGYRFATPDGDVDVYAKAHRRGDAGRADKVITRARIPSPWGPGAGWVADDGVFVCTAANDPRLPGTRHLADPATRAALLERLLPRQAGDVALRPVRYKPERRFVARADGADGPVAVIKCYAHDDFVAAKTGARAFRSDGPLRIASMLGAWGRRQALAVPWQAGSPLSDIIAAEGRSAAAPVAAAGDALARLHAQPDRGLQRVDRPAEALHVLAAAQAVAVVAPELAGDVRALAVRLSAALLALPDHRAAVHGDFSADQVLIAGARVAIIDLDSAVIGDPAADVGLFRATLLSQAAQGRIARSDADGLTEALLDGYTRRGADPRARLDVYTAAYLVRLAAEPFRHRLPAWPHTTAAILRLAFEAARACTGPYAEQGARRLADRLPPAAGLP